MIRTTRRRSGFTLLEVLLASSISLLLLAGLYIILDLQLAQMSAGREKVERTTVVRSIFNRFSRDLSYSMTPLSAVAASTDSTATNTTGTAAAASTTTTDTTSTALTIPIGSGVIGDGTTLTIYGSIVAGSTDAVDLDAGEDSGAPQPGDQCKISFWMGAGGLCRSVEKWTTSDSGQTTGPSTDDEALHLIAPEVESMTFEYFDGTSFSDSWDGSQLAADGVTPIGPPRAIRVHLFVKTGIDGESKEFRKTIAILTGPAPPTTSDLTDSATTTGGTSP